jgi:hypothetical protein
MVQVSAFIQPEMRVKIEAYAVNDKAWPPASRRSTQAWSADAGPASQMTRAQIGKLPAFVLSADWELLSRAST